MWKSGLLIFTSTSCACWKLWSFSSTQLLVLCKVKWRGLNWNIEDLQPGWHSIDRFLDTLLHEMCLLTRYLAMIWKWIRHKHTDFTDCLQLILMSRIPRFFLGMGVHVQAVDTRALLSSCVARERGYMYNISSTSLSTVSFLWHPTHRRPAHPDGANQVPRKRKTHQYIQIGTNFTNFSIHLEDENCTTIQFVTVTLVPSLMSWQLWNYVLPEPDQEQCRSVLRNGSLVPGQH